MEKHYRLSDPEFERQFANCTLRPMLFTHEAHLRLAWIHVTQYGVEKAVENVSKQIKAFALHHGVTGKYHATITEAAVRAVYHSTLKSKSNTFPDFIAEFPQLKVEFKKLINSHYSIDIFRSEEAREKFLEPDLVPFD